MRKQLYQQIASCLQARLNCQRDLDRGGLHETVVALRHEWLEKHRERALALVAEYMPSGSGFDGGTHIDLAVSTPDKLVFYTSFHHMDEHGSYDGWSEHVVTVKPSLVHGFTLSVSGRDRDGTFKDYLAEVFDGALRSETQEREAAA